MNRLLHDLLRRSSEEIAKEIIDSLVRPLIEFVEALIEQGVASGHFRRIDPALFYIHVNGACDMLFSGRATVKYGLGINDIDKTMRQKFLDQLMDILLTGIRKP